jgi:alcohol dehydrogenase class IV
MTTKANWSYPTLIRFGVGRIRELENFCEENKVSNPLLVTDKVLANLPIIENVLGLMKSADLGEAIFSEVDSNPTDKNLEAGIIAYREGNHDGVIAVGGGSALDLGKLIAFMHGQVRPVWDFEDVEDWWTRADSKKISPIIAIPTTAGTGSEAGRASVITNSETHDKKIIFHPKMLPAGVICDPELTVGMPPVITAGTGMDAFSHCLEAYCTPLYHPLSQGIAIEGMRLIKENLFIAYSEPNNLDARGHMMSAALMGATAFQKGLGAMHALSHPIGAVHHTHHGTTNAVVMKPVLYFNRFAIEKKINALSRYIGIEGEFDGFCNFVESINDKLAIPKNLTDLGLVNPDIEQLVKSALEDPSVGGNPITMNYDNTLKLLENCL